MQNVYLKFAAFVPVAFVKGMFGNKVAGIFNVFYIMLRPKPNPRSVFVI